jgi:hypothetical protein
MPFAVTLLNPDFSIPKAVGIKLLGELILCL